MRLEVRVEVPLAHLGPGHRLPLNLDGEVVGEIEVLASDRNVVTFRLRNVSPQHRARVKRMLSAGATLPLSIGAASR